MVSSSSSSSSLSVNAGSYAWTVRLWQTGSDAGVRSQPTSARHVARPAPGDTFWCGTAHRGGQGCHLSCVEWLMFSGLPLAGKHRSRGKLLRQLVHIDTYGVQVIERGTPGFGPNHLRGGVQWRRDAHVHNTILSSSQGKRQHQVQRIDVMSISGGLRGFAMNLRGRDAQ